MKNRSFRMISILCAAALLICAFSAFAAAEGTPATPTELTPVQPQEEPAEAPAQEETTEDGIDTVEVFITKTLALGQSWEGTMSKTKPAVLKLDLAKACSVHMLVEGKDVQVSVEKSDKQTENPPRTQTDPEIDRAIISWEAEAGSYLITLTPAEPNPLAKARVSFMDDEAYAAWEAAQEAAEEEEGEPEEEPEVEPEAENETKTEEAQDGNQNDEDVIPSEAEGSPENEPEEAEPAPERHITVELSWDVPEPDLGDTAHLKAILEGYDQLTYTLQWQYSPDDENWTDALGETGDRIDITLTEDNDNYYWRIVVFIEEPEEA